MEKSTILFLLLEPFADWEAAPLAALLNDHETKENDLYQVKTVGITKDPIRSIGGFTVIPDYAADAPPELFAGIVLVGSKNWGEAAATGFEPLVRTAVARHLPIGSICAANDFLATLGLFNDRPHTGNSVEELEYVGEENYTNSTGFMPVQALRNENFVMANGTAPYEFAKLYMELLGTENQTKIDEWYDFNTLGFYEAMKKYYA